jgi:disulfide oxidoreductase YuzD
VYEVQKIYSKAWLTETINTHRSFKKISFETKYVRIPRRKRKHDLKMYTKERDDDDNLIVLFPYLVQVAFNIK